MGFPLTLIVPFWWTASPRAACVLEIAPPLNAKMPSGSTTTAPPSPEVLLLQSTVFSSIVRLPPRATRTSVPAAV